MSLFYIYIYNFYFENLTAEWPYFLGNILVGDKVIFLPDCHLVFSLLKHRGVGAFLNKKKKKDKSKLGKPLNSIIYTIFKKIISNNSKHIIYTYKQKTLYKIINILT